MAPPLESLRAEKADSILRMVEHKVEHKVMLAKVIINKHKIKNQTNLGLQTKNKH